MRWLALVCGLLCGALNYAMLAKGCNHILSGRKRGVLFIAGGFLISCAGLVPCALIAESCSLLPWFGCACGGALSLLAMIRMAYDIRKTRKT